MSHRRTADGTGGRRACDALGPPPDRPKAAGEGHKLRVYGRRARVRPETNSPPSERPTIHRETSTESRGKESNPHDTDLRSVALPLCHLGEIEQGVVLS